MSREGTVLLLGVRYDLTIWQGEVQVDDGRVLTGPRRIEGRIDVTATDLFTLMDSETPLLLALEDGRSVNFFVSNTTGRLTLTAGGSL